jgi:hypothetical protein
VRVLRPNGRITPVEDWLQKSFEIELELPEGFDKPELLLKAIGEAMSSAELKEGAGPHPDKRLRKSEELWLAAWDWDELADRVLAAAGLQAQKAIGALPPELDERALRRIIRICSKFFGRNFKPIVQQTLRWSLQGLEFGTAAPRYVLPILAKEQKWVELYIRAWLHRVQAAVASDAAKEILEGYRTGRHPMETAAAIRARIAGTESPYRRDWRRLALTTHAQLNAAGRQAVVPDGTYMQVITYGNACSACKGLLEGKILKKIAPPARPTAFEWDHCTWIGKNMIGVKRANWKPCVPLHPNCRDGLQEIAIERWWVDAHGYRQPRLEHEKEWKSWRRSLPF